MAGAILEEVRWRSTKADLNSGYRRNLLVKDQVLLERVVYEDPRYIEPYVELTKLRSI